MPFLGPMSYLFSRRLKSLIHKFYPCIDLKVVFKRGFCIGDIFRFKDKMPLDKMPLDGTSGVNVWAECGLLR